MVNTKTPQCSHCFGQNWQKIVVLNEKTGVSLWTCGHGPAHAEEMKNGCSRVIAATDEEMNAGGVI